MTILITGTSAGIGFSLAEHFGRKGHKVYGLSRKTVQSDFFKTIATDITNQGQVARAVAEILEIEEKIDLLINNAGMGMVGAVEDSSQEEILRLFNLNVVGSVHLISAVLPTMRLHKKGKIINVSSIGSEMGLPFRGFYSASKSALDKITEALRYEVFPWNIQVCALHLGDIKTKIAENRVRTQVSKPYEKTFTKVYALMNSHVDEGDEPAAVAEYIENLLTKRKWKAHYYFGKFGQRIGVPLKWLLPQLFYEKLMRKYNSLDSNG